MKTSSEFGQNVSLSFGAVQTAILKKIHKDAKKKGVKVPPMHELLMRGQFHLLDANNQAVTVDRVLITFDGE